MMGLSWPGSRQQGRPPARAHRQPHFTVREGYMDRRDFLRITGASAPCRRRDARRLRAGAGAHRHRLRRLARLRADRRHQHRRSRAQARLWIPVPDSADTDYQRGAQTIWRIEGGGTASLAQAPAMACACWPRNGLKTRTYAGSRSSAASRRATAASTWTSPRPPTSGPKARRRCVNTSSPPICCPPTASSRPPPTASRAATAAIWRGRARSTNGWSRTPAARPPPEAAAWATCATCSRPMT